MRLISCLMVILSLNAAHAAEKIKLYFNNEDITKIIEIYSKASGQKFVVDPSVRGKASIFLQEPVTVEEAFNHLSSALAVNGFGISKQGDTMVVKSARNIQRDFIEVSSERPTMKPERMYTWVYTVKSYPADDLNSDLRVLLSRDGELAVNKNTNQLVITDWTANLNRIADILKETDKKNDPETSKIIESRRQQQGAPVRTGQPRFKEEKTKN